MAARRSRDPRGLAPRVKVISPSYLLFAKGTALVSKPIYNAHNLESAYQLRYDWTCWPSRESTFPPDFGHLIEQTKDVWENDGLRLLESNVSSQQTQLLFSVTPQVSAVFCTQRAKGRLQYAARQAGSPIKFSRKLSLRTVGNAHSKEMLRYIERQALDSRYLDQGFRERLEDFVVVSPEVDLSLPTETRGGRYWYNLHLVLTTQQRYLITDSDQLGRIRDMSFKIADKKGYRIASLSAMPDHLHIALRGNIQHSPEEVALGFQNNLAYVLGQNAVWNYSYYVGSFSEYNMEAIRRALRP